MCTFSCLFDTAAMPGSYFLWHAFSFAIATISVTSCDNDHSTLGWKFCLQLSLHYTSFLCGIFMTWNVSLSCITLSSSCVVVHILHNCVMLRDCYISQPCLLNFSFSESDSWVALSQGSCFHFRKCCRLLLSSSV